MSNTKHDTFIRYSTYTEVQVREFLYASLISVNSYQRLCIGLLYLIPYNNEQCLSGLSCKL